MAHSHSQHRHEQDEQLTLGPGANRLMLVSFVIGLLGLGVAALSSNASPEHFRRFYFGYLAAFMFFLSLGVGGVFFLLVTYCTRSGWSIAVRRVPEALAKTLPLFIVLSLPILYTVVEHKGQLYRWAQPAGEEKEANIAAARVPGAENIAAGKANEKETHEEVAADAHAVEPGPFIGKAGHAVRDPSKVNVYLIDSPYPVDHLGKPERPDELVEGKLHGKWAFILLQPAGWLTRVVLSLIAMTLLGWWYTRSSKAQDISGDTAISERLSKYSAPLLIIFGFATTFLAYDLMMSLDPIWYSTIFGGYYFAGAAISVMAATILVCRLLQMRGYLTHSINKEHYHDLSKFQFAFTFFWGYLAFSQFMLQWYSSQPEELTWLARRGASTAQLHLNDFGTWTAMSLILIFGKLLIPFGGLLSRHVKRSALGMIFWAAWILLFQYVDMHWLVMPELTGKFYFGLPEIGSLIGVGGLFVGMFMRGLSSAALRPMKDPRLTESLAFHQSF